ncbi:hypothetical protein ACE103_09570 [Bradyrhizobium sp. ma5]|uniref:hypothetical protein n=1 Tax=Bradyrhizobium sp. ma5 TaxID=3344828 RepID=UPI0035D4E549
MDNSVALAVTEQSPKCPRDIFAHLTDSINRSERKRPLGELSNFTVEKMPLCIAEVKCSERPNEAIKAFGRGVNAMLGEADYNALLVSLPQCDFEVAKTDIQYLVNCTYQMSAFAGLDPSSAELTVGTELNRLASLTCQRQPSIGVLSYEDMILTNPIQTDPRLYCLGVAGVEERDFCIGHQLIESELQSAMGALLELRDVGGADAPQCLARCLARLRSAHDVLTRFDEHMSPDLFSQFRVFYGKNPYKNTLGPSGRFSARVVAVSVLLVGEDLFRQKPQFYRDLYRLSEYYPQASIGEVFRWLSPDNNCALLKPAWLQGKASFPRSATISPLIEHRGREIKELHAACVCALDRFTRMHRSTALKHTVGPGRPLVGIESSESIEDVLCQRLLTPPS